MNIAQDTGDQGTNLRDRILILFDVDGTITPARQCIQDEVDNYLQSLRRKVSIGLVGGSDMIKIAEQTLPSNLRSTGVDAIETCINRYDYVFAENGLVAYSNGKFLAKQSILNHLGEQRVQRFINFCLGYMSKLYLPIKRGNFIELRNGLINVCPVGRSCSQKEREEFNAWDNEHHVRKQFIEALNNQFGPDSEDPVNLTYSIGGQISFDVFPVGWDKTFCLNHIPDTFEKIYFFGDKTYPGGNDYEIFAHERTIGYSVVSTSDTIKHLECLQL